MRVLCIRVPDKCGTECGKNNCRFFIYSMCNLFQENIFDGEPCSQCKRMAERKLCLEKLV